jgi:hypothetical protein
MKSWRITITKTDGSTIELEITPRTVVAFERHFKVGLANAFSNEQKMEHLYWLAWDAERVSGQVVALFDKWLETIVSVDIAVDASPLDEKA